MKRAALGLMLLVVGCGDDSCPTADRTRTVTTGTTDLETLTYASAPWDGPLDEFPGQSTVSFEHNLGVAPDLVSTYVAFEKTGTGTSDVTENAGDQGEIVCVDENVILVRNGTCARFFIRVVAARLGDTGVQSQESCPTL